ncbi:MAG: hypothetical protein O3B76_07040 [Proteobacteria bacterium]|nr:hypothetical protein [Pseudomonadota bacterium]MDA1023193.1 hypothetical protein [Pseudomonadota bacterium]
MKKLIIIIALLVMLTGGAIAALKTLSLGPFKNQIKTVKAKEIRADTAIFIDMEPLGIPIFRGNRVIATIQIQVKLETGNEDNSEIIKRKMPVIRDAFIRDLHSFMPRLLKAKERVDVLIVKQRLQYIGDKVAGKGLIKNVLVQSVLDQPR